jgi:hypothetical protein
MARPEHLEEIVVRIFDARNVGVVFRKGIYGHGTIR